MKDVVLPNGFTLEPLTRKHLRQVFSSGQPSVDRFLRERALQAQDKRLSSTKVVREDATDRVAGYFTLAMGQVGFGLLPAEIAKRLPRRDLPVAILAWLGVDQAFQRRGLGERLLAYALRDCWGAGEAFPFVAVVLDCLDSHTKAFYQRWNFREVPGHATRLFLSYDELAALMTP